MLFYKRILYIRVSTHLLCFYESVQFPVVQGLQRVFLHVEVIDCQIDDSVQLLAAADVVFQGVGIVPDEVFLESPSVESRVPYCRFG